MTSIFSVLLSFMLMLSSSQAPINTPAKIAISPKPLLENFSSPDPKESIPEPGNKNISRRLSFFKTKLRLADRFTSVDPIVNKAEALVNPQLWNLYSYCNNNPISYFDPDGKKIQIKDKELISTLEYSLGVRLQFNNKKNPNLVTGFIVKHEQLKDILRMFQEIIDDPKMIAVYDRHELNYDSITLAIGGGSFNSWEDYAEAIFDKDNSFRYRNKKGFFTGQTPMPLGEKIIHEVIGHGYDWIKGKKSTEKGVIKRVNEYYRKPLELPERKEAD